MGAEVGGAKEYMERGKTNKVFFEDQIPESSQLNPGFQAGNRTLNTVVMRLSKKFAPKKKEYYFEV